MKTKQIFFTEVHHAELLEEEVRELGEGDVLTEMEYTVVSGGTERAFLMGMQNTSQRFPMSMGYCGVGRVLRIGREVKSVSVGDRVLVYHGHHAKYNVTPDIKVTKIEHDAIKSLDAAFVAKGFEQRFTQHDCGVFDGVVLIDMQVAFCLYSKSYTCMVHYLIKHMIKERQTSGDSFALLKRLRRLDHVASLLAMT